MTILQRCNIKITIAYLGKQFSGWQTQKTGHRTVQGKIEKALRTIFRRRVKLIGAGRTDSGVHAMAQVANFQIKSSKALGKVKNALNGNLDDDIAILKIEYVPLSFHAQYSAKSKIYCYTILNRKERCVFSQNIAWHFPYTLNLHLMRQAANLLKGRKDFCSFQSSYQGHLLEENKKRSTIRTVQRIEIRKRGDFVDITIEADGFLYKMARNIVGILLAVGRGRLTNFDVKHILEQKKTGIVRQTAKAKGLRLVEVKY